MDIASVEIPFRLFQKVNDCLGRLRSRLLQADQQGTREDDVSVEAGTSVFDLIVMKAKGVGDLLEEVESRAQLHLDLIDPLRLSHVHLPRRF
jgi:hypothetical protein